MFLGAASVLILAEILQPEAGCRWSAMDRSLLINKYLLLSNEDLLWQKSSSSSDVFSLPHTWCRGLRLSILNLEKIYSNSWNLIRSKIGSWLCSQFCQRLTCAAPLTLLLKIRVIPTVYCSFMSCVDISRQNALGSMKCDLSIVKDYQCYICFPEFIGSPTGFTAITQTCFILFFSSFSYRPLLALCCLWGLGTAEEEK